MKNILGNKHQRYYRRAVFRYYRAGFVLCLIIVGLIFCPLYEKHRKIEPSRPFSQTITHPVVKVVAQDDKYTTRGYARCYDVIICIRDIGEEMGFDNQEILTAIRIAKAESGLRADAINKNKGGTFDIGVFQINDVHSKRISRADRLDFEKNIQFAWNLRKEQGNWGAWSVCKNKVDCR